MDVLLIESNDAARTELANYFTSLGAHVDCVSDGVAAMLYLRRHFDIVLIDMRCPHLYSAQFAQMLVRYGKCTYSVIAAMYTGRDRPEGGGDGLYFSHALKKPVSSRDLQKLMRTTEDGQKFIYKTGSKKSRRKCRTDS